MGSELKELNQEIEDMEIILQIIDVTQDDIEGWCDECHIPMRVGLAELGIESVNMDQLAYRFRQYIAKLHDRKRALSKVAP